MSDITGVNLLDYTALPQELHTTFSFFYICSDAPEDIKSNSNNSGVCFKLSTH